MSAEPPSVTSRALPRIAEAVLVDFIAVAGDREEDLAVEEAGLVKGHDAVAVGDIANLVDRLELDQGDAASGPFLDDVDAKNARASIVGRFIERGCRSLRRPPRGRRRIQPGQTMRGDQSCCGILLRGLFREPGPQFIPRSSHVAARSTMDRSDQLLFRFRSPPVRPGCRRSR